jgi:hypothetical protein
MPAIRHSSGQLSVRNGPSWSVVSLDHTIPRPHGEGLYSHLPSRKTLNESVPQLGVPHRLIIMTLICVSVFNGEHSTKSTPVVWPCEIPDEDTPFVPTYISSAWPLPLSCCISVILHILTFQMHVDHLIPGQLSVSCLFL